MRPGTLGTVAVNVVTWRNLAVEPPAASVNFPLSAAVCVIDPEMLKVNSESTAVNEFAIFNDPALNVAGPPMLIAVVMEAAEVLPLFP